MSVIRQNSREKVRTCMGDERDALLSAPRDLYRQLPDGRMYHLANVLENRKFFGFSATNRYPNQSLVGCLDARVIDHYTLMYIYHRISA